MKNTIIGLVGASGFGSEVLPLLENQIKAQEDFEGDLVLIDSDRSRKKLFGRKVISEEEFLELSAKKKFFNIAISSPEIREKVYKRLSQNDIEPLSILSEDMQKLASVEIKEGAIICPQSLFTSNIKVGKFFHCNYKSVVAHDCRIGDFVTLAPGVFVNGNVTIEDRAYIGAGAIIKQGIKIGKNSVVGMGAIVLKDVSENTTVIGNPARVLY